MTAPWFETLGIRCVLALTLIHRSDRRTALNASAKHHLPKALFPHYVWQERCALRTETCATNGWRRMLDDALRRNAFPALLVEDDIDFKPRAAIATPLPHWDILSLASVHHTPKSCQDSTQPNVYRPDGWRNWGNAAMLFSSHSAVKRLLRTLEIGAMRRHKTLDMKLFATSYPNVWIACPPVLRWITSHSDVLNVTRSGS